MLACSKKAVADEGQLPNKTWCSSVWTPAADAPFSFNSASITLYDTHVCAGWEECCFHNISG